MGEDTVVVAVVGFSLLFYSETTDRRHIIPETKFSFCLLALAGERVRKGSDGDTGKRGRDDLFV